MLLPQKIAITAAVACIAIAGALFLRQSEPGNRFLPKCLLYATTGLHCPSCGNTRASRALLKGDVVEAVEQNVIFVIALPFLALGACRVWWGWIHPKRRRPLFPWWRWYYSLVLIGLVIAFGVLRNLPMKPFNWLAPEPINTSRD